MKLTRTEEVAVLIVSSLAGISSPVSLSAISARHGVPQPFLKKITRMLRIAGIIDAKEGTGGGYFLSRPANRICLADIIRAVSGSVPIVSKRDDISSCPLKKDCLPFEIRRCINHVVTKALSGITISQVPFQKEHL